MAYVTEIDIFVYDPSPFGYVGGDPRGYYVHEEYDISAKLNIWPIFMKITHDNLR